MKKKYKILCTILALEYFVLKIMQEQNIVITYLPINLIGTALLICPILLLLHYLSYDKDVKPAVNWICRVFFWFFIVCFGAGILAELFMIAKN